MPDSYVGLKVNKNILRRNAFFSNDFGFPLQISIPPVSHADSLTHSDVGKIAAFVAIVLMDPVALRSTNK